MSCWKMVNKYELIKELKSKGLYNPCLKHGLISINSMRDFEIVGKFIELKQKGKKSYPSFLDLSIDFDLSESRIESIVRSYIKVDRNTP